MRHSSSSTEPGEAATERGAARFFARHPRATVLGVLLVGTAVLVLLLELGLRTFGSVNIHYYTGTQTPGLYRYPYGDVPINADGYPDEDFVLTGTKRRIGYVGDSVAYGVGAGYGYRIPDLLQQRYPQYDHWVFAVVGDRLEVRPLLQVVRRFKLDAVVYLMNLNDVMPEADSPEATTWIVEARSTWLAALDASLRGTSYLYTYLRLGVKNTLQKLGYETHGLIAFETFPMANQNVIEVTALRVANALDAATRWTGSRGCVILLPYEMQISQDAADAYRKMGFKWEAGFEEGSTQRLLLEEFRRLGVTVFDGREAFVGADLKVGDAFVYDKGDKVDWNHPNRRGHAMMAQWLIATPAFQAQCLAPNGESAASGISVTRQ